MHNILNRNKESIKMRAVFKILQYLDYDLAFGMISKNLLHIKDLVKITSSFAVRSFRGVIGNHKVLKFEASFDADVWSSRTRAHTVEIQVRVPVHGEMLFSNTYLYSFIRQSKFCLIFMIKNSTPS